MVTASPHWSTINEIQSQSVHKYSERLFSQSDQPNLLKRRNDLLIIIQVLLKQSISPIVTKRSEEMLIV